MKALALFSGGLDSSLAIRVIQEQGIEVIALNFVSHFFGGKDEKAENMAKQLGVKLEYIDFKRSHTEVVGNPPSGRGKNINPCIDCHALMFEKAGELLKEYGASFIISGEVLGQRPMSQNYNALIKVQKLSKVGDIVVRPLSGRILPSTLPEEKGWIKKDLLLDIQGRSRKRQMALMDHYNLVEYPSPGGGCLLTESNYSGRLLTFEEDGFFKEEYSHLFHMAKVGRFFRLDSGKYLFVGRTLEDNLKLSSYKDLASLYIVGAGTPGPAILGFGSLDEKDRNFAMKLFSRYSKEKGMKDIEAMVDGSKEEIKKLDLDKVEEEIKLYLYTGKKS